MDVQRSVAGIRQAVAGRRVALVPTMGNLHEGHLTLMRRARDLADTVVATIFVNRLQFRPGEDFDAYPRTWEADLAALEAAGVDLLFAPTESVMYPSGPGTVVQPPTWLDSTLEAEFRPGHFAGVATVVLKLLSIVGPDVAVFGKKDYQQLLVIRTMVADLNVPVEIVGDETVRAPDGLALSSRNGYLSVDERTEAPRLAATLRGIAAAIRAGATDFSALEEAGYRSLSEHGWQPDYVAIRSRATLRIPEPDDELVVLAAARLGTTRLIDNLEI
ncbi:MAG: pantoate--beta-alanine ligase [Micropruina sp.]|nr:MAG: pantoate--beta-alanine ligase [Micropruina sp.]